MDRTQQILDYLRSETGTTRPIGLDTSLFRDRILDSMNLAELLAFLEETFRVCVLPSEVTFENLDSVRAMLKFLDRKISAVPA